MNKKKFAEQVELLVAKNNELYSDNVALSNELEKKEKTIAELNGKLAELSAEIDSLNEKLSEAQKESSNEHIATEINEPSCVDEEKTQTDEVFSGSADSFKQEETTTEEKITVFAVPEPRVIDVEPNIADASVVIGKAVVKCAEVCNLFTSNGGPNAKDLVNLALGRTEVFKSEILSIVSENGDFSSSEVEINAKLAALDEYFDLLKKQI